MQLPQCEKEKEVTLAYSSFLKSKASWQKIEPQAFASPALEKP